MKVKIYVINSQGDLRDFNLNKPEHNHLYDQRHLKPESYAFSTQSMQIFPYLDIMLILLFTQIIFSRLQ